MDIEQKIARLENRLSSVAVRVIVSVGSAEAAYPEVTCKGRRGREMPEVEILQPQGLWFGIPADAEGVAVSPAGDPSNVAVLCAAQRLKPAGASPGLGEGGLHYLGTYRVFLRSDGTVALGARDASDWAALASLVDARIAALQEAFDTHSHPGHGAPPSTLIGPLDSTASTVVRCT